MDTMVRILRDVGILILAYAVIVIFGIISQDLLFDGVSYPDSGILEILTAGTLNILGAVVGGGVIGALSKPNPFIVALVLTTWLLIESTLVHFSGSASPIWFDVGSGLAQGLGVLLGCYLVYRKQHVAS